MYSHVVQCHSNSPRFPYGSINICMYINKHKYKQNNPVLTQGCFGKYQEVCSRKLQSTYSSQGISTSITTNYLLPGTLAKKKDKRSFQVSMRVSFSILNDVVEMSGVLARFDSAKLFFRLLQLTESKEATGDHRTMRSDFGFCPSLSQLSKLS